MSKNNKSQLNKQTNTTASQSNQLFVPLNQQEQQAIAGGWDYIPGRTGRGSGWW